MLIKLSQMAVGALRLLHLIKKGALQIQVQDLLCVFVLGIAD